MHLALHTGDDRHRLPEVALGVAWRVGQGHEHLLGPPPVLPDVILDCCVSAVEPVLVPQPLKDPLGSMALLPGNPVVSFQYAVNHPGEGRKLGTAGWVLAPVPWRYRVGQHLAHCVPVQTEHPGGFPNAHPLHHAGPANPRVHLHCKHPSHLPKTDTQPYGRRWAVRFPAAINQPAEPPTWSTLPPPFTGRLPWRTSPSSQGCTGQRSREPLGFVRDHPPPMPLPSRAPWPGFHMSSCKGP